MSSASHYDRVGRAIARYKVVIEETLKDLRSTCVTDIVFIFVIPIVISIIAYLSASFAGLAAVVGLGTINAGEKFGRGQTILKSYRSDCARLRKSVRTLELEHELCDSSDDQSLKNIESKLRDSIKSLP